MTKYLVLYKSERSAREQLAMSSPDEQQAGMNAWMDWVGRVGHAIVDLGSPLAPASPGAEPGVGGFSILQADSAETLQQLMKGHPHTEQGGTIECFEFLTMSSC